MKNRIYLSIALIIIFCIQILDAQMHAIQYDNIERTFLVHLPINYSPTNSYPLVIAMHGGGGSALNIQNQSQLSNKSDKEGFIVVYPEGVVSTTLKLRTWNAGWCCGYASRKQIDDVGFIDALMEHLIMQYSVDSRKIYATGISNGGMMAYRLACELSYRFAAIAPVATTMTLTNCTPERIMPIIHFHSAVDYNVPMDGGYGTKGPSDHYNPPIDSVMNAFGDNMNCENEWISIVNNDKFIFEKRDNCACSYEIHKYVTKDGGHSWPGGRQTVTGDPSSEVIDANDLMWDFFKLYNNDCSLTSNNKVTQDKPLIFPNPSNGTINIQFENKDTNDKYTLYNHLGKRIVIKNLEDQQIDISHLSSGIYYLAIKNTGRRNMYKIILLD